MKKASCDRGVTLIETMVAVMIALIGMFGLGNLVFRATVTSKNQGTEMTRAVIYAQDKIEKILSLAAVPSTGAQGDFAACTQAASLQPSVCDTTGVAASGWITGLLAGGSASPVQIGCPSSGANVGYMDFLDTTGSQVDPCTIAGLGFAYVRQWQITDLTSSTSPPSFTGGPAAKQVTVAVYSLSAVNAIGGKPIVIVTSLISNPN
jgi:prepilin-type N-terminal cleavage/methylation domain-containing protein